MTNIRKPLVLRRKEGKNTIETKLGVTIVRIWNESKAQMRETCPHCVESGNEGEGQKFPDNGNTVYCSLFRANPAQSEGDISGKCIFREALLDETVPADVLVVLRERFANTTATLDAANAQPQGPAFVIKNADPAKTVKDKAAELDEKWSKEHDKGKDSLAIGTLDAKKARMALQGLHYLVLVANNDDTLTTDTQVKSLNALLIYLEVFIGNNEDNIAFDLGSYTLMGKVFNGSGIIEEDRLPFASLFAYEALAAALSGDFRQFAQKFFPENTALEQFLSQDRIMVDRDVIEYAITELDHGKDENDPALIALANIMEASDGAEITPFVFKREYAQGAGKPFELFAEVQRLLAQAKEGIAAEEKAEVEMKPEAKVAEPEKEPKSPVIAALENVNTEKTTLDESMLSAFVTKDSLLDAIDTLSDRITGGVQVLKAIIGVAENSDIASQQAFTDFIEEKIQSFSPVATALYYEIVNLVAAFAFVPPYESVLVQPKSEASASHQRYAPPVAVGDVSSAVSSSRDRKKEFTPAEQKYLDWVFDAYGGNSGIKERVEEAAQKQSTEARKIERGEMNIPDNWEPPVAEKSTTARELKLSLVPK